jgi:hypothetical protein
MGILKTRCPGGGGGTSARAGGGVGRRQECTDRRLGQGKERICRELGNEDGLLSSLGNQVEPMSVKLSRHGEALPLVEEAYRLANACSLVGLVSQIKSLLDSVRSNLA